MEPLSTDLNKIQAVEQLAQEGGLGAVDPYAWDIGTVLARIAPRSNHGFRLAAAEALGLRVTRHFLPRDRPFARPHYTNGRPDCFPEHTGSEHSPAFDVMTLTGGYVALIGRAPVVLTADRRIVSDFSSPYAALAQMYDVDLDTTLADAKFLAETAVVLCDDVHPLNFAHWLLDELPRLAFLGERRDVRVVLTGHVPPWQRDSLRLCGFDPKRVAVLEDFEALRAQTLLVPRDLHRMPHPAHKAAPWVSDFLRARIGFAALVEAPAAAPGRLYVSRADAGGRRVVNEDAVMQALAPLGFRRVVLGELTLAQQVAAFAGASHVVGLHGAGMANFAFARTAARLLEIFPRSYGTPAYYVLAAGQGSPYATYIANDVVPGARAQVDDVRIDVADLLRCCAGWL